MRTEAQKEFIIKYARLYFGTHIDEDTPIRVFHSDIMRKYFGSGRKHIMIDTISIVYYELNEIHVEQEWFNLWCPETLKKEDIDKQIKKIKMLECFV